MRIRLLLSFSFILLLSEVYAISAYPGRIPVVKGNDTILITLRGDENCKYASDEDGYTLLQSEKGWYYATTDDKGNVIFSSHELVARDKRPIKTDQFLQSIPKGLIPHRYIQTENKTRSYDEDYKKGPAIGLRKTLIILMQFQDTKFSKTSNDFHRLFNEVSYQDDGAIGSVYDYYKWTSYGQLDLKSDIWGPYTAQNFMSYYGRNEGVSGNDSNPYGLFLEAINQVIKDVNLNEYDADGDGYVDNIHIIYAGYGEEAGASSNAIWAHEMTFRTITIQGMKIDHYSCAPELRGNRGGGISRIGPHCHEIGHALGAMDFYDTDYETGGNYLGTGKWDIMASGSWNDDGVAPADFNPYVKIKNFGWTSAQELLPDTINTIAVSSEQGNIYKVKTGTNNDYFLLENRDGQFFHSGEPGKGLLIFHIGPNLENRALTNTINSTYPQQCYVVCASSTYSRPSSMIKSYGDINSDGCPYPGTSGNSIFNGTSIPAALTISGFDSGININDIHYEGQNIEFFYGNNNIEEDPDNPPSIPDESYLWAEDFEQLRLPASWEYTNLIGTGDFSVTTKLSTNDSPDSPVAANGLGYAKFTPIPRMVIGEYRTSGRVISPRIRLVEGKKYILELYTRKYNSKKESSKDTLSISLTNGDGNNLGIIVNQEINNQNNWERITVPIPEACNDFLITITCDVDYGSLLFIDNITIIEQHEETSINTNKTELSYWLRGNELHILNNKDIKIYTIDGTIIYIDSPNSIVPPIVLQQGYYVIKQSNGVVKKIHVNNR